MNARFRGIKPTCRGVDYSATKFGISAAASRHTSKTVRTLIRKTML